MGHLSQLGNSKNHYDIESVDMSWQHLLSMHQGQKIKGTITLLWHSSYSNEVTIFQFSVAQPQVIFKRGVSLSRDF